MVGTSEKTKKENTLGVKASSIKKRIPLLIPLLIPNFTNYHSIVRLLNVSWASIFAS
jgi:hypothetical protein